MGLEVFVFTIKLKLEFEEPEVTDRAYIGKGFCQPDSEEAFKGFFCTSIRSGSGSTSSRCQMSTVPGQGRQRDPQKYLVATVGNGRQKGARTVFSKETTPEPRQR